MKWWAGVALCLALVGCGSGPQKNPRARKVSNRRPPATQMRSPIGGYMVRSETPDRRMTERDIVVTRPDDKREIIRFPFRKQVDVVWAPDESGVAVVDLVFDNETRVVVFELPSGRPVYELRREAVCELNPDLPCGAAYTHVFFSNVVWQSPNQIQVTVDMVYPLESNLPPRIRGTLVASFPR